MPVPLLSQKPVYASSPVLLRALKRNRHKEKAGEIRLWVFLWVSATTGGVWTRGADLDKSASSLAAVEIWIETRFAIAALLGEYRLGARHSGYLN